MKPRRSRYHGHRFPAEIISHAVWRVEGDLQVIPFPPGPREDLPAVEKPSTRAVHRRAAGLWTNTQIGNHKPREEMR